MRVSAPRRPAGACPRRDDELAHPRPLLDAGRPSRAAMTVASLRRLSGGRSAERPLFARDAVHKRVPVACLGSLRFEPGLERCDRLREHLPEILDARKIADDAFYLGVVEQRRPRLVAHERTFPLAVVSD